MPADRFCLDVDADQIARRPQRVHTSAVDRRRAPRTVAVSFLKDGSPGGNTPQGLAVETDGQQGFLDILRSPHGEDHSVSHGDGRVALAETRQVPGRSRTLRRPLRQQARFFGVDWSWLGPRKQDQPSSRTARCGSSLPFRSFQSGQRRRHNRQRVERRSLRFFRFLFGMRFGGGLRRFRLRRLVRRRRLWLGGFRRRGGGWLVLRGVSQDSFRLALRTDLNRDRHARLECR